MLYETNETIFSIRKWVCLYIKNQIRASRLHSRYWVVRMSPRTHARIHTCLNAHECRATTLLINAISSVKLTVWEYLFYALTNMAFDLLEWSCLSVSKEWVPANNAHQLKSYCLKPGKCIDISFLRRVQDAK